MYVTLHKYLEHLAGVAAYCSSLKIPSEFTQPKIFKGLRNFRMSYMNR